jgi:hypothetical protein
MRPRSSGLQPTSREPVALSCGGLTARQCTVLSAGAGAGKRCTRGSSRLGMHLRAAPARRCFHKFDCNTLCIDPKAQRKVSILKTTMPCPHMGMPYMR